MHPSNRGDARGSLVAALALTGLLAATSAPAAMERTTSAASAATSGPSVPPGAPAEDVRFANEWPAPNGDLYNTRVAHTTISAANVATLKVAWTLPLKGMGDTGADVANPVIANGIAYLQDGASNVMAVRVASGQVLWTHRYNSPDYGPNGVTIANGKVYGVTATGVFALDAKTGRQLWTARLAAGCNATLAIAGSTLLVGAGLAAPTQHPIVVAYRLGAKGH